VVPPSPNDGPSQATANAAGGSDAKTVFFGIEAQGRRFVYIVDRSGSMAGAPLRAAKEEVKRSLRSLTHREEFLVLFFSNDMLAMPGGTLVLGTEEKVREITQWIDTVSDAGGTSPMAATQRALDLDPDAIWLLSDGDFGVHEAAAISAKGLFKKVPIHTIAFWNESATLKLEGISMATGGTFRFVPEPSD
jgi:hypothetical protein